MDRTPAPILLAAARALPWKPGRSAEAFVDGELEIRFTPRPTNGPQVPHRRDEVYVVAGHKGNPVATQKKAARDAAGASRARRAAALWKRRNRPSSG